ncbi:MAG TPA: hypothetical protein PK559_08860 [Ignavibacteriaceae bacterium]|nr:hypothetical protein [Ignavibacteriaceae bacterium]
MKFLIPFLISSLLFIGCKENDIIYNSSSTPTGDYEFDVTVVKNYSTTPYTKSLNVYFQTSNISEVPFLKLDDTISISKFNFNSSGELSTILEIPFSESINFELAKSGKSTTGKIETASGVINLKCNNTVLQPYLITGILKVDTIPVSGSYYFEWECAKADSFLVELHDYYANQTQSFYTTQKSHTFQGLSLSKHYLRIYSIVGSYYSKLNLPNHKSGLGNGYIFSTQRDEFSFTIK